MIKRDFKLISFYTDDWEYPDHARRLQAECEQLGIDHRIEARPNTGSYTANSRLKPQFIWDVINSEPGPFLWVDVDGSVLKYPSLVGEISGFDIGARRRPPGQDTPLIWHVGTLWIDTTPAAFEMVDAWRSKNRGTDDNNFSDTYKSMNNRVKIYELPAEYFFLQYKSYDQPPAGTVIMHRLSYGDQKYREKHRI